ncbi:MAG: thiamine phosphate synthase [Candidatus Aureabacteria bacterium]|nr:thiamine phosphate synthase [Candidatus Auribacterota bacterium]
MIIDRGIYIKKGLEDLVYSLINAGVRWFQYRDKCSGDGEIARAVSSMLPLCREAGARLIVNDRADIASRLGADGVHLGQGDMAVVAARRTLGKDKIIGCSTRLVEEAERAEAEGADYLGVGAIYQTRTKPDARVVGVARLAEITRRVKLPVIAVGGITRPRVSDVLGAGATGIAVASAILSAPDPAAVARALLEEIRAFREK